MTATDVSLYLFALVVLAAVAYAGWMSWHTLRAELERLTPPPPPPTVGSLRDDRRLAIVPILDEELVRLAVALTEWHPWSDAQTRRDGYAASRTVLDLIRTGRAEPIAATYDVVRATWRIVVRHPRLPQTLPEAEPPTVGAAALRDLDRTAPPLVTSLAGTVRYRPSSRLTTRTTG